MQNIKNIFQRLKLIDFFFQVGESSPGYTAISPAVSQSLVSPPNPLINAAQAPGLQDTVNSTRTLHVSIIHNIWIYMYSISGVSVYSSTPLG